MKPRKPIKKRIAITDTERIDALQRYVRQESLTLWDGHGEFPGKGCGLSLHRGGNLRLAIDQVLLDNE